MVQAVPNWRNQWALQTKARRSRSPLRHAWMSAPEVLHSTVPTIGLTELCTRSAPLPNLHSRGGMTRGNVAVVGGDFTLSRYHASSGHTIDSPRNGVDDPFHRA